MYMSDAIIPYLAKERKGIGNTPVEPTPQQTQAQCIARHAWALAARLDYLAHGQGRIIAGPIRQRMLASMALDARMLATVALDVANMPAPIGKGGAQ